MRKYYIGVDPGRHTGVAVWSKHEKKLVKLLTLDFWSLVDFLDTFTASMQAQDWGSLGIAVQSEEVNFEVVMEDPNLIKAIYKDRLIGKEALTALTMAQSVGRNKEQAFLLMAWMEKRKIIFRTVKPKNRNAGGGKWSADYFRKMAGWDGTSNEHTRDAARFVIGL